MESWMRRGFMGMVQFPFLVIVHQINVECVRDPACLFRWDLAWIRILVQPYQATIPKRHRTLYRYRCQESLM